MATFLAYKAGFYYVGFGDGNDYLRSAESIINGGSYLRDGLTWPFFRPPGYPFVISSVWVILGTQSILVLKLLNIFLHMGSTFLVYKLVKKKYSRATSLFSLLIFGLNPLTLIPSLEIQTEPLVSFLILIIISLLAEKANTYNTLVVTLSTILLVATRPEYLLVILGIFITILFRKSFTKKKEIFRITTVMLILCISLGWWGAQNYNATGKFMPLTNATEYFLWNGSTKWIANNYPLTLRTDPTFDSKQYVAIQNEISRKTKSWGFEYESGTLAKKTDFWWSAYRENVSKDITAYAFLTIYKAQVFWRPFLNPMSHGLLVSIMSFLLIFPMTVLSILGSFYLKKERDYFFSIRLIWVGLLVLTLVHMLQMPDQRYKFPVFVTLSALTISPYLIEFVLPKILMRWTAFNRTRNESQ